MANAGAGRPRRITTSRRNAIGAALLIAGGLAGAPYPGNAEDRAVQWLMREPVTLFDLGILRLREDLKRTADRMAEAGDLPATPLTGAFYDLGRQRIVAYVTLTAGAVEPSEAVCRESYLENLFLHEGPGNLGRPNDLAADLAATVQLEVTLLARDPLRQSPQMVKCVGRLDSEPDEVKTTVRG
jgi:hypothetical protein